jgi:chromosomal replication initiation ATPase DnaA
MKVERIQPEVIRYRGRLATIIGGRLVNENDFTRSEISALKIWMKYADRLDCDFDPGIIHEVAKFYGVTVADIMGDSRRRPIPEARQYVMYQMRFKQQLSTKQIGIIFGKDHTTVIYACKVISDLIKVNQLKIVKL